MPIPILSCAGYSTCQAGDYISAAGTPTTDVKCSPCPAGQYCTGGSAAQTPCGDVSRYSTGGASSCSLADPGYFTTPGNGPNTTNQVGEQECLPGYACLFGLAMQCNSTSYQDQPTQSSCKPCLVCPRGLSIVTNCTTTVDATCKGTCVN